MKSPILYLAFVLLLSIQQIHAQDTLNAIYLQNQIDSIRVLQRKAAFPSEPSQIDSCHRLFNVEDYFNIFAHLHLQAGWRINYVYNADIGGRYPVIIAYDQNLPINIDLLKKHYSDPIGSVKTGNNIDYLDHVVVDSSMVGFMQFVILKIVGSQFALGWHAGYNDETVVCTKQSVEKLLMSLGAEGKTVKQNALKPGFVNDALSIDLTPWAAYQDDNIVVRLVTFTKWGGFFEKKYSISQIYPHRILKVKKKELVGWDCGYIY
jgi:hypothetical protein